MKRWTGIAIFFALAAWPVLAGSAPAQPPENMPESVAAGYKAWAGKCSRCHAPERAYSAKYTQEKQIKALVSRMARKPGAGISRNDQKAIVAYLVWHAKNAAEARR
jgi:mono/diheme cytochrome c family protein